MWSDKRVDARGVRGRLCTTVTQPALHQAKAREREGRTSQENQHTQRASEQTRYSTARIAGPRFESQCWHGIMTWTLGLPRSHTSCLLRLLDQSPGAPHLCHVLYNTKRALSFRIFSYSVAVSATQTHVPHVHAGARDLLRQPETPSTRTAQAKQGLVAAAVAATTIASSTIATCTTIPQKDRELLYTADASSVGVLSQTAAI